MQNPQPGPARCGHESWCHTIPAHLERTPKMEYQRQSILLESTEKFGHRPPVELCGQVFRRLHPVMASSVRMAFEGRSTASGEQPRWLKRAADVRVLGFSDDRGNTMLELEAQRLGDAAEEIYKQRRLWNDL